MSRGVLVIGGGCAGLAAATRLAEQGFRVTLLEARAHLGGRTYSFQDRRTGEVLDNGQHLFMGCYHETRQFLTRIGTWSHIQFDPQLDVPYLEAGIGRYRLKCPRWPAPFHLARGLLGFKGVRWRDRLAATRMQRAINKRLKMNSRPELDIPASQWFREIRQTARLRHVLWDPVTLGALNVPVEEASANILANVLGRMFFADHDDSLFGLSNVGLSELLVDRAVDFIEHFGGQVHANAPVAEFLFRDDCCHGVRLREGRTFEADAIISAMPHRDLAKVLPQFEAVAEQLGASPIVNLYLWFDRPVMVEPYACLLATGIHWAFDRHQLLLTEHGPGQCLALTVSAADEWAALPNDRVLELAVADLARVFPEAARARLTDSRVIKERTATFRTTPGIDAHRPKASGGPGGLILAGDWTRTGLPATIEGAVQSGHVAARQAEVAARQAEVAARQAEVAAPDAP